MITISQLSAYKNGYIFNYSYVFSHNFCLINYFLFQLLKECNLSQLMQKEHQVYRQIQSLDSEMQTLVYENYNKFISATDTIRKVISLPIDKYMQ